MLTLIDVTDKEPVYLLVIGQIADEFNRRWGKYFHVDTNRLLLDKAAFEIAHNTLYATTIVEVGFMYGSMCEKMQHTEQRLTDFLVDVNRLSHARGWWDEYDLCKKILLIVSECTEAMEADRKGRACNLSITKLRGMLAFQGDENFIHAFEKDVKHTFPDELADICIRTLDLITESGFDAMLHMQLKHRYNLLKKPEGKKY